MPNQIRACYSEPPCHVQSLLVLFVFFNQDLFDCLIYAVALASTFVNPIASGYFVYLYQNLASTFCAGFLYKSCMFNSFRIVRILESGFSFNLFAGFLYKFCMFNSFWIVCVLESGLSFNLLCRFSLQILPDLFFF
jgi:hypothetical protein